MTTVDPYTFEFEEGTVREWRLTDEGAVATTVDSYAPSIFASGPAEALESLRTQLAADPKVGSLAYESWATDLHEAHAGTEREVLKITLTRVDEVRTLAREIRGVYEREAHAPGTFRLFDVDLTPGFRYCLDRGFDPTPTPPGRALRTLSIEIAEPALANGDVSSLTVDGESVRGEPAAVLDALARRLDREDPDVLVLSHADLVPTLAAAAVEVGFDDFSLGRLPGWTRLAGENTYESYGQVGHSPARYRVPGRAIIDTSNSFLWHQSDLEGLCYMVRRTGRPLQEAAWGSIGTLLTARQIRLAREWGVLAPLNKWESERFKDVSTLHTADRGGFTFAPSVGFHEEVHEIDFASLYPRIICERNVSPETVECACRASVAGGRGVGAGGVVSDVADNGPGLDSDSDSDSNSGPGPDAECKCGDGYDCEGTDAPLHEIANHVPELGYAICRETGFLPHVLGPLLDDRAAIKERLAALDNEDVTATDAEPDAATAPEPDAAAAPEPNAATAAATDAKPDATREATVRALRSKSGAIKWVLVSCFGYQGYRNAKFGRIECHEAINAYAREIALEAKARLEDGGWHIVHGIVDSLWVTPRVDDPEPLATVIEDISQAVGIPLEHDGQYEWVCFVPRRESIGVGAGAGTGSETGSDLRSRSPPASAADSRTLARADSSPGVESGPAGALTKYFGKRTNGAYKFRGIEARQRSTPAFVADCQREFVEVLDRERDPEAVCDVFGRRLGALRRGAVDPASLVITKRVSKRLDDYRQRTHTVAALRRYARCGIDRQPGQSVQYVVVDDDARGPERVRLAFEYEGSDSVVPADSDATALDESSEDEHRYADPTECTGDAYDADYYAELLLRACESVVSPLGWDHTRIRRFVSDGRTVRLSTFGDPSGSN